MKRLAHDAGEPAPVRRRRVPIAPPPPGEQPVLWSADEAAAWLRTTRTAVYAAAERGTLPGARRFGRRLLVVRDELVAAVLGDRVSTTEPGE